MGSSWYCQLVPIAAGRFSKGEFGARGADGEFRVDTLVQNEREGCSMVASMVERLLTISGVSLPSVEASTSTLLWAQRGVAEVCRTAAHPGRRNHHERAGAGEQLAQ